MIDPAAIRSQFPCLARTVGKRQLVYLDNTATSQTPREVVDAIVDSYENHKANVHRGVHTLSQEATMLLEDARRGIQRWIGAAEPEEVIFTRGTTEALNLVAYSAGPMVLKDGGTLVLTAMEHHANIVPWQLLQRICNFNIEVVDIDTEGCLDLDQYRRLLARGDVKIVSFTHISNVLGSVNPVKEMVAMAHEAGALACIDGAQAVPHARVDVQQLGCDFYAFSAHKMYGPAGIGVLYGRRDLLEKMPPWQGGGEMIANVSLTEGTTFAELPYKFEAGTPDFVDAAAFHRAARWIDAVGVDEIAKHEDMLLQQATNALIQLPGAEIYGTAPGKCSILSFNFRGIHPYDLGMLLDKQGIAVRTGHHCAQPLMTRLGITGCVRASFAVYNTPEEIDSFISALKKALSILR